MTEPEQKPAGQGRSLLGRPVTWLVIVAAIAGVGAAAIYGMGDRDGNVAAAGCDGSAALARAVNPLATGEVAALIVHDQPMPAPALTFTDDDGAERTLADWKGKAVLLNLWATWCAPCRHEMPALDNLQAELGGDSFEVVAVNIDTGGDEKPKKFLDEIKVDDLGFYADHTSGVFRELKKAGRAFGLPTTLVIDAQGCEIGHMAGPAEWDSNDAKALIEVLIDPNSA